MNLLDSTMIESIFNNRLSTRILNFPMEAYLLYMSSVSDIKLDFLIVELVLQSYTKFLYFQTTRFCFFNYDVGSSGNFNGNRTLSG